MHVDYEVGCHAHLLNQTPHWLLEALAVFRVVVEAN